MGELWGGGRGQTSEKQQISKSKRLTEWLRGRREGSGGDRSVQHVPHRPPARPRVRPLRGAGGALAWTWRPGRWPSARSVAEKMAPRLGSVSTVPASRGITTSGPGPLSPGDRWRGFPGRGRGRRPSGGCPSAPGSPPEAT